MLLEWGVSQAGTVSLLQIWLVQKILRGQMAPKTPNPVKSGELNFLPSPSMNFHHVKIEFEVPKIAIVATSLKF
jgi:hypothetical protein